MLVILSGGMKMLKVERLVEIVMLEFFVVCLVDEVEFLVF